MALEMRELLESIPQTGKVCWIGVRPARKESVVVLDSVKVSLEKGLDGDRFDGKAGGKRQVTLIQKEHLAVIGSILGQDAVDPVLLRRNIVVQGINLVSLKRQLFAIGDAVLQGTGACAPCSRMEEALGAGGYNAMRGHGGLTATVVQAGTIKVGDEVKFRPTGRLSLPT